MGKLHELDRWDEQPFNSGKIIDVNGLPGWQTEVGGHQLVLDIVPVVNGVEGDIGIASFVVMEQDQSFLGYAGKELAQAVAQNVDAENILLMTAESKGSHFVPWVWSALSRVIGNRLSGRVITCRKGEPKAYMRRPACIDGQEIPLPSVTFRSITSPNPQILTISPRDLEYLLESVISGVEAVYVDDFIGAGGTAVAITRMLESLEMQPPRVGVVVGSDGDLYRDTFREEGVDMILLPKPFLLRLPTFFRPEPEALWQVR